MMRVGRFSSDNPNFEFFLLRIHLVNELEGPIDDSKKKSIWTPPYKKGKNLNEICLDIYIAINEARWIF